MNSVIAAPEVTKAVCKLPQLTLMFNEICAKAHARVAALLRGRCFFSHPSLIRMYKMQVLSFVEASTPALYHAPAFFLARLDAVQEYFLSELGLDPRPALLDFNLAPLAARRDIAMLGLIHRTVLAKGPPQLQHFFHASTAPSFPRCLRGAGLRHGRQLQDPIDGTQSRASSRSALSLIYSYNLLPQSVVDAPSVAGFQRKLSKALRKACETNVQEWGSLLSCGVRRLTVVNFQSLF